MPSYKTEVTYFHFAASVVDPDKCEGDMRNGVVSLTWREGGKKQTIPGSALEPQPLTAPPAAEPDTPFVGKLFGGGWVPRAYPGDFAHEDGVITGQPAGMGRAGIYEALELAFTSAFICYCRDNEKECSVSQIYLSCQYDGRSHPKIVVKATDPVDCADAAKLLKKKPKKVKIHSNTHEKKKPVREDVDEMKKRWKKALEKMGRPADKIDEYAKLIVEKQIKTNADKWHTDANGEHTVEMYFRVRVPCPCKGEESEKGEKSGKEEASKPHPCDAFISVTYNYRTVLEK